MEVLAIRRGYGYLFNASLFSQFHATVNTLSTPFMDGKLTRGSCFSLAFASWLQTWRFQQKPISTQQPARKKKEIAWLDLTNHENIKYKIINTDYCFIKNLYHITMKLLGYLRFLWGIFCLFFPSALGWSLRRGVLLHCVWQLNVELWAAFDH